MAPVCLGPSLGHRSGEERIAIRTVTTPSDPCTYLIWKVSSMAFMVEGELFDSLIADVEDV